MGISAEPFGLYLRLVGMQCLPTLCEISEFLIFHFPCNSLSSLVELHLTHAYFSIQQKLKRTPFQTSRTLSTKFLPFWNSTVTSSYLSLLYLLSLFSHLSKTTVLWIFFPALGPEWASRQNAGTIIHLGLSSISN